MKSKSKRKRERTLTLQRNSETPKLSKLRNPVAKNMKQNGGLMTKNGESRSAAKQELKQEY